MQQCEPPQQQREDNRQLEVKTRDSKESNAYECRICGYKAADVCSLSQHLHSVHPVTALPGPSSVKDESKRASEGQKSPPEGNVSYRDTSMYIPVSVYHVDRLFWFGFGIIRIWLSC